MNVTVEQVKKATKGQSALYLVKDGQTIIGQLEKYNNTKTEYHPWKAFLGTGIDREFLGSFYSNEGGKEAAIDWIKLKFLSRQRPGFKTNE